MLRTQFRTTIFSALAVLAMSACNRPVRTTPVQPGADIVYTAAAQTVEAQLTLSASGIQPTFTPVPVVQTETPVPTVPPTDTPPPTDSPEPTATGGEIPCDRASFVTDVTIPDGTEIQPGATFEKTWRLRNNGSCTWNANYALIFSSGDAMGGPASVPITSGSVAPNQEVDITVELTAPTDAGTYRGNWRLRNAAGENFGIGANADKVFWVEIEVPSPTPTPSPDFNLAFETVHDCEADPTVILKIENTGNAALESVELTLVNMDASSTIFGPETSNAPFMGKPVECPPGGPNIPVEKTRYIGARLASLPQNNPDIRATVKLCTGDNLDGACIEKTVDFKTS